MIVIFSPEGLGADSEGGGGKIRSVCAFEYRQIENDVVSDRLVLIRVSILIEMFVTSISFCLGPSNR